ncbi:MAG TPA: tryptophan 7-halogenase [Bryobacteraceae bacterium]
MFDAAIIGGGPAGATAGRLLAQWGHSVTILTAPSSRHPSLAECLPPSTHKLFHFLGVQEAVDRAGFFPTTGNTVWWGKRRRRIEAYPDRAGYQVRRSDFDRLLLELASAAGALVQVGKAFHVPDANGARVEFQTDAKRAAVPAKMILDCSGRAGVIGRSVRVKEKNSHTVALCGIWRSEKGWTLPDASHTLVESYADGWAWSVPISPLVRYVAFMVNPRKKGLCAAYLDELAKTRAFRKIFSRGKLETGPWGADASLYSSKRFYGPGFLLAGDAGSFIDPLSSFGVKKAMVSAWVAAVVVNTCLRRPAMRETAFKFFDDREREVYTGYLQKSAALFREAGGRSAFSETPEVKDNRAIADALNQLKRKSAIRLLRAENVRVESKPVIEGREIVLRDALTMAGLPAPLDYFENVDLPRLVDLAVHHTQVPDLFEGYNRACRPVALPNFLAALAMLLAERVLVDT